MTEKMEIVYLPLSEIIPYARNPRDNLNAIDKVASSIKEFGWQQPIVIDSKNNIIAGHTRYLAAQKLGIEKVPVQIASALTERQIKAYRLADNRVAQEATWNTQFLALEFEDLKSLEFDLSLTGFNNEEIANLFAEELPPGSGEEDSVPDIADESISKRGDIWILGNHRLMCGDSTVITDVDKLMRHEKSCLLHADPPYGMGKQKDGVENDNLYGEKLDQFQLDWWNTFRPFLVDNTSVYIWGNAPELWRLWYAGGLAASERLTIHNEIVWDKETAQGIKSPDFRSFPIASERCLFFMLGEQGYNNNSDNFWEGFEPIRSYLENERNKMGWNNKDIADWFNMDSRMARHWFTKSQWTMPTEEQYKVFQEKAEGKAFLMPYESAGADLENTNNNFQSLKGEFYKTRAYFNNAHDMMTDVWRFPRVTGEERHGHATPKPVAMMERIINSSSKKSDIIIEPFAGSGTTLIACEKIGRFCFTMELSEKYCDVIIKRWQNFTGKKAIHEEFKKSFDEMRNKK